MVSIHNASNSRAVRILRITVLCKHTFTALIDQSWAVFYVPANTV